METIFEKVYVETPVDTDEDGKLDLIAVYIKRPKVDKKVPVVYVANPYMLHCNEDWYELFDVKKDVKIYPEQTIKKEDIQFDFSVSKEVTPLYPRQTTKVVHESFDDGNWDFECVSNLYDHLIEREYAAVFSGGLGTRGSDGIELCGSREEVLAFKAVIDWLNGRARAFTNKTDNIEVKPLWTTGNVAMSAKSYLGTMCMGVATTGVEGLKTIIPEAGICNWYDYYRCNGLVVSALGWSGDDCNILAKYCTSRAFDPEDFESIKPLFEKSQKEMIEREDRDSANYNQFWDERNYLNLMDNVKCSAFIIQGLEDWNVKPNQATNFFKELEKRNIDRRLFLHRGEHVYTYGLRDSHTLDMIDAWLDHYLKGVDNGIESEPKVYVESNVDQSKWDTSDTWPVGKDVLFPIQSCKEKTIIDDIKSTVYTSDNNKEWLDELVLKENAHSLKYSWKPEKEMRISGNVKVSFKAKINQPTAILSAMLVEVNEYCRLTSEQVGDVDNDYIFKVEETPSKYKVISRGWMNAQNKDSLYAKVEIKKDTYYNYSFEMISEDYTIHKESELVLILYGIDVEQTQIQTIITNITIDEASIQCFVPIV